MRILRSSGPAVLACWLASTPGAPGMELTAEHRQWLEEEVVYIILEREKEIFLALETVEERERFIESFWRRRDPNPTTPSNEFRDEHYRRLDHANRVLGRSSATPGWRGDRGRMYILLGEPASIERFQGYNEIVSSELWFYRSEPDQGLPPFFSLVFFRPHNVGDFQLYHPVAHGPTALLSPQLVPTMDGARALEILNRVSPELRRAALSADPSDPGGVDGRASPGADILLARIQEAPKRTARGDGLEAFLRYRGRVEADYSFNFVSNRSGFAVLVAPDGTAFVHFTLELDPEDFALETDEERSKFYTTLDVELEVKDASGNLVSASENELYLEFAPEQMEAILTSPFAYRDNLPLLPGDYELTLILKNRVLKRFTAVEHELEVRSFSGESPRLSDLAIGYHAEPAAGDSADEHRTFQVGGQVLEPAADNLFVIGETLHALVQAFGAAPDGELRLRLRDESRTVQERSIEVGGDVPAVILERFPLEGLAGGSYMLEAELLDPDGRVRDRTSSPVTVSPRSGILRPWSYRRSFDIRRRGRLELELARQHLALEQFSEARARLEVAARAEPPIPPARWLLAGLLIQSGEDQRALDLLKPLEADWPYQFEVIGGLGSIHYLRGDWALAIDYLERAVSIRPPDTALLNALGDAYRRLGHPEKARAALERSLTLNPDQEDVKKSLESLTFRK